MGSLKLQGLKISKKELVEKRGKGREQKLKGGKGKREGKKGKEVGMCLICIILLI